MSDAFADLIDTAVAEGRRVLNAAANDLRAAASSAAINALVDGASKGIEATLSKARDVESVVMINLVATLRAADKVGVDVGRMRALFDRAIALHVAWRAGVAASQPAPATNGKLRVAPKLLGGRR